MNDATLGWSKESTGTATAYQVTWIYNGTPQTPYTIPVTAAQDATGYTQDFATANPTITVGPGDTIDATVVSLDVLPTGTLSSTGVTPPAVTEPPLPPPPPAPPGPPQNVTLVLS